MLSPTYTIKVSVFAMEIKRRGMHPACNSDCTLGVIEKGPSFFIQFDLDQTTYLKIITSKPCRLENHAWLAPFFSGRHSGHDTDRQGEFRICDSWYFGGHKGCGLGNYRLTDHLKPLVFRPRSMWRGFAFHGGEASSSFHFILRSRCQKIW